MYFYACFGYVDDDTASEDNPTWRIPYVVESLFIDGQEYLPYTRPDSGPFDTYNQAWERAKEIACREFRTSWED